MTEAKTPHIPAPLTSRSPVDKVVICAVRRSWEAPLYEEGVHHIELASAPYANLFAGFEGDQWR